MANAETAIYSILSNDSTLTAIIGTKLFPVVAEQGAANPLVVFSIISERPTNAMGVDINPVESTIQISCYSDTGAQALSIKDAVKNALQRYQGTSGGVVVQDIFYENQRADYDGELKEHRRDLDFRVYFEE